MTDDEFEAMSDKVAYEGVLDFARTRNNEGLYRLIQAALEVLAERGLSAPPHKETETL